MYKAKYNVSESNLSQQVKSRNIWHFNVVIKVLGECIIKIPENEVTCNWEHKNEEEVDDDPNCQSLMSCVDCEKPFKLKKSEICWYL